MASEPPHRDALRDKRLDAVRLHRQGFFATCQSFFRPVEIGKSARPTDEGLGVVGLDPQGLFNGDQRRIRGIEFQLTVAQIQERCRIFRVDVQQLFAEGFCLFVFSRLDEYRGQIDHHARAIRGDSERLSIAMLRLDQLASLLEFQRGQEMFLGLS